MRIEHCRALVTGASGGIGRGVAIELAKRGATLLLVGRREEALKALQLEIIELTGSRPFIYAADLTDNEQRKGLVKSIQQSMGGVDLLLNGAGVVDFSEFSQQDPMMVERIYRTNLTAPVLLSRELLPSMLEQKSGTIVNIGSIFGSIGFAYFSAYSSSKFALRGFSEALRREVAGSGVDVLYIAPRATKTEANSNAVYEMAEATKMHMDSPEQVAQWIVKAIIKGNANSYRGFAENIFVRLNSLFPSLVDSALRKQNKIMARFASKHS